MAKFHQIKKNLKEVQNAFHLLVRRAKRYYQQIFLDCEKETWNLAQICVKYKKECLIALKYTKPKENSIIVTLIGPNNKIVMITQAIKELVRANAFLGQIIIHRTKYKSKLKTAHFQVTKYSIGRVY